MPGQAGGNGGPCPSSQNLSATEPVVTYNTFIVLQGKPTTVNLANNQRRCGPPSDADECKDDG